MAALEISDIELLGKETTATNMNNSSILIFDIGVKLIVKPELPNRWMSPLFAELWPNLIKLLTQIGLFGKMFLEVFI